MFTTRVYSACFIVLWDLYIGNICKSNYDQLWINNDGRKLRYPCFHIINSIVIFVLKVSKPHRKSNFVVHWVLVAINQTYYSISCWQITLAINKHIDSVIGVALYRIFAIYRSYQKQAFLSNFLIKMKTIFCTFCIWHKDG